MERYLLFDSGCSLCSNLAQSVQAESNGLLTARSLREPAIQAILNEVKPGWQWEPMLLEMDDDGSQQVFSGLQMRLRIVSKLGLSHAWRIAKLVGRTQLRANTQHAGRRSFLRYAGGVVTGVAMAGFHFSMGKAQTALVDTPGASGSKIFLPILSAVRAPSAAEAQQALELVLASPMFLTFHTELEAQGIAINTSSSRLDVVRHEGGEFYGAEGQSVIFVGQKEEHRVYQVFLGTHGSNTENEETWLTAFVDTQQEEVIDVFQFDVSSVQEATATPVEGDIQRIVMRTANGGRAVGVFRDGDLALEENTIVSASGSGCSLAGGLLCASVGLLACTMTCAGPCWTTGIGCLCFKACEFMFVVICTQSGNPCP
ncbi:hypothetical protein GC175_33050 [bacterium]|nr:hypothetical protein [bacterium]